MTSTMNNASSITFEERIAEQVSLYERIRQQYEKQNEIKTQISNNRPLTPSLSRIEPDLGDNVFDMLDDLIMIPSHGLSTERSSLSRAAHPNESVIDEDPSSQRDSLADINESLDMDLADFELGTERDSGRNRLSSTLEDEPRLSYDDDDLDIDELDDELEYTSGMADVGVDDDEEFLNGSDSSYTFPFDSPFVTDTRSRLSSMDDKMTSSISSSTGSVSHTGNLCTLIWEGGLLGIRLRMSQSRQLPAISRLTGRSSIFGIHLVEVGDLLLEIGGRYTRDMDVTEAVQYLKQVEKPCRLVFRRINADPMAVKPIQPLVKSKIALKLQEKFAELAQAENEKTPIPPTVQIDAKYEVKWLEGPLGISLVDSKDIPYPLVTRITGKNRSLQVQDVQPGHYLVQIGDYNTSDGNFTTAIKYLQKVAKPVSLYFCPGFKKPSARPEIAVDEHDQVWEKKQVLGFTVKPDENGKMVVADVGAAKSLKVKAKNGASVSSFVESGDRIIWINDDPTKDLPFREALLKLRTAKRPLIIRFKKPNDNNTRKSLSPPFNPDNLLKLTPVSPVCVVSNSSNSSSGSNSSIPNLDLSAVVSSSSNLTTDTISNSTSSLKPIASRASNHPKKNSQPTPTNIITNVGTQNKENSHLYTKQGHLPNNRDDRPTRSPHGMANSGMVHTETPKESQRGKSKPSNAPFYQQLKEYHLKKNLTSSHDGGADNLRFPQQNQHRPTPNTHLYDSTNTHAISQSPSGSGRNGSGHSSAHTLDGDIYEVIWPEGMQLGLTLRVHPTSRYPVVARVTGTANLKNIEHVQPGDILIAANGQNIVPQPKFKHTLDNLMKLPKPAKLRFKRGVSPFEAPPTTRHYPEPDDRDYGQHSSRAPPLRDYEYEFVWRENTSLGLVFQSDNDIPRVTRVDFESGGPMLNKISLGDILTWIGPREIRNSTFQSSMATLRNVRRPVVLRFQKRTAD